MPPLAYCMDNAAMVAGLAYHLYQDGKLADEQLIPYTKMVKKGKLGIPELLI